jgi:hypothetical protein
MRKGGGEEGRVPCQKEEDAIIEMGGSEVVISIRKKRRPHEWVEVILLLLSF